MKPTYRLTQDDIDYLDSIGAWTGDAEVGVEATPDELTILSNRDARVGQLPQQVMRQGMDLSAPEMTGGGSIMPLNQPAALDQTPLGAENIGAKITSDDIRFISPTQAAYGADKALGKDPLAAEAAPDTSIAPTPTAPAIPQAMTSLLDVTSQAPNIDPFSGLSKNQRLMLAFSAIEDAGAALRGQKGGSFEAMLGRFNEIRDMERKRQIQTAELQARQQVFGSLGASPLGPNPTPEEIDAHIAKLTGILATNPSMAPYVTAELARLNPMRERAASAQSEIAQKQMMISQIDNLLLDPDLGSALGIEGFLRKTPAELGLDENAARVWGRINQIKGGAFLQAFESLKGGGQITELEGQKAEQAQTRLNTAQNEKDFREALKEYKFYIDQGVRRLRGEQIPPDTLYGQGAKADPWGIRS